ncbi:MAG: polysaccharide biosynthesis/export family protein [Blastocatellia bacterium]
MSRYGENGTMDHLNKTISWGLLLAVVFTGLAFGAVEPWSIFVFQAIVIALVVLWGIKVFRDGRLRMTIPDVALPVAALVAVGLTQSVAFTGSDGRWMSLSMNVGYTRSALTVLSFLLISLIIACNFFASRERLAVVGQVLVFYGLAVAIFALIQDFTWSGRFYWVRPTLVTSAFGPFANHNHFAGYMELLIPLPIAMILTRSVSRELRVLYGFAAAIMGLAAVVSLSRGGMISLAAMMMFIVLVSMRLPGVRLSAGQRSGLATGTRKQGLAHGFRSTVSQLVVVAALVLVIGAGILWIGADPIIQRVSQGLPVQGSPQETFSTSRGWIWRDTITMIRANPLLGVGLGAYVTAFNLYTKSDGSLRVPQAHNDYLQVVADCGIVGGLIALWFIVVVFRTMGRGLKARDPMLSALALASGAGIFGILVHSLFDFNLQIPSNALLFLVLVAVASSAATLARTSERAEMQAKRPSAGEIDEKKVSAAVLVEGASMTNNRIEMKQIGAKPRFKLLSLAVSILAIVAGPGFGYASGLMQRDKPSSDQSTQASPMQAPKSSSARGSNVLVSLEQDYRIGANDVIDIQIENAPELSRSFRVTASGTFLMPFIGRVTAVDKTPEELAQFITDGLRGDYLKDPKVTVAVKEYNSRSFFIQGAVRSPGVFQIEGKPSLLELITLAGGLAENHGSTAFIIHKLKQPAATAAEQANQGTATVTKVADTGAEAEDTPRYELRSMNINGLLKGRFDQDTFIEPGDIVNIPPSDVFFVAGEVNKPGSFVLKDGTSLRQAVSLAQGTTMNAAGDRAVIFREGPTGKREELKVDVTAVMNGKKPDVPILANDIVMVPNSRMKSVGNAVLKAFGLSTITRFPIP